MPTWTLGNTAFNKFILAFRKSGKKILVNVSWKNFHVRKIRYFCNKLTSAKIERGVGEEKIKGFCQFRKGLLWGVIFFQSIIADEPLGISAGSFPNSVAATRVCKCSPASSFHGGKTDSSWVAPWTSLLVLLGSAIIQQPPRLDLGIHLDGVSWYVGPAQTGWRWPVGCTCQLAPLAGRNAAPNGYFICVFLEYPGLQTAWHGMAVPGPQGAAGREKGRRKRRREHGNELCKDSAPLSLASRNKCVSRKLDHHHHHFPSKLGWSRCKASLRNPFFYR